MVIKTNPSFPLLIGTLLVLGASLPASASSASSVDQQQYETIQSKKEAEEYSKLPPNVFSPGGRLYGVERVAKESMLLNLDGSSSSGSEQDAVSCGVFALHCGYSSNNNNQNDGEFAVIVGIGPTSSYLHRDEAYHYNPDMNIDGDDNIEQQSHEHDTYLPLSVDDDKTTANNPLAILSPTLIIGTGGKAIDSTILLRRAIEISLSMYNTDNGGVDWFVSHSLEGSSWTAEEDENYVRKPKGGASGVDVTSLVRSLANMAQSSTQNLGGRYGRMLSSSLIAVGERNPSNNNHLRCEDDGNIDPANDTLILWRVDPTGQFWRVDASAVGRGAINIESELIERIRRWKIEKQIQQKNEKHSEQQHDNTLENVDECNIFEYLRTLSLDKAVEVAKDCFIDGIMRNEKQKEQHSSTSSLQELLQERKSVERGLRKRMQTVIIRSKTSFGNTSPFIEVL